MRHKITYEDELKSATSILLQHIDRDLQTSLAIVQGYKKAYEDNDVYKIKLMVKIETQSIKTLLPLYI